MTDVVVHQVLVNFRMPGEDPKIAEQQIRDICGRLTQVFLGEQKVVGVGKDARQHGSIFPADEPGILDCQIKMEKVLFRSDEDRAFILKTLTPSWTWRLITPEGDHPAKILSFKEHP